MRLRSAIVPAVNLGAWVGPMLFIGGLIFNSMQLESLGLIAFSAAACFALVTLPVEFKRQLARPRDAAAVSILRPDEIPAAKAVLKAAALTYVAAALQSVGTLIYYAMILSRRRN